MLTLFNILFPVDSSRREIALSVLKGTPGVGAPVLAIQAEVDWIMHLFLSFLAICVSSASFFSILLTIRRKQREAIDFANRKDRELEWQHKRASKAKYRRRNGGTIFNRDI